MVCLSVFSFLSSQGVATQSNLTITDTVVDETGQPFPGVVIYLNEAYQYATFTDFDGNFSLQLPMVLIRYTLVFSFIDYHDATFSFLPNQVPRNMFVAMQPNEL